MVKQRLKDRADDADQGVAQFVSRTLGIYEPPGTRNQIVNQARTRIRELATKLGLQSQGECSTSEWRPFLQDIIAQKWFSGVRTGFIAYVSGASKSRSNENIYDSVEYLAQEALRKQREKQKLIKSTKRPRVEGECMLASNSCCND